MDRNLKLIIKTKLVSIPRFMALASWFTRHTPKFFMFHRFTNVRRDSGSAMSAESFEKQLQVLKNGPWKVVALRDYLQIHREKQKMPPYLVVLTIDDGYLDFYDVAYPLLLKYNLPATFFVTTKFVEGKFWLWHDRIHYILENTMEKEFSFVLGEQERSFSLVTNSDRSDIWKVFSDYCIQVRNEDKWETLSRLEKTLKVTLPESPSNKYSAVSWQQLQEMAENNIEIGSHTIHHPILSKIDSAQLEIEIALSKKIITEKLNIPVQSFCYPNGQKNDIDDRVVNCVERAEYFGAVQGCNLDFSKSFRLPRMGIGNDLLDFQWKLSGLELLLNRHE